MMSWALLCGTCHNPATTVRMAVRAGATSARRSPSVGGRSPAVHSEISMKDVSVSCIDSADLLVLGTRPMAHRPGHPAATPCHYLVTQNLDGSRPGIIRVAHTGSQG